MYVPDSTHCTMHEPYTGLDITYILQAYPGYIQASILLVHNEAHPGD